MCVCVQMEEVPGELTQDDFAPDDVMILDTWDQVSLSYHHPPSVSSLPVSSLPVSACRSLFGSEMRLMRRRRWRRHYQVRRTGGDMDGESDAN